MVKVTLKDGSIREFEAGTAVIDIAQSLSRGLAKAACVGKIDGEIKDLRTPVNSDCTLEILTFEDDEGKKAFRHTASHILAHAVKRLFPSAKLAIGPAIENGFYYDFDVENPFTPEDLEKIEAEMKKIVKEGLKLERFELEADEAIALMEEAGEIYKAELIREHAGKGEKISFFKQGDFADLCAGPHLTDTGKVKAFKLTSATGAYWRGDSANKMLQRIYGTAFTDREEMEAYLLAVEEAKKRDHNIIGRQLGFFTTSDVIGQGLPLLMPKGAKVVQLLQRFVEDEEERRGYQLTKTPLMAKSDLFKLSGHWDHYKDGMFVLGDEEKDDEVFALRPMTCPFQFTIYNSELRSYRDLPIRYGETSTLFRNESSGEMHGLIRVRQFTISEGHLICTPNQLADEFKGVMDLASYMLKTLGLSGDISYRFSKHDPDNKEKFIDDEELWATTEAILKDILDDLNIEYTEAVGEAAFYGPKLDIQIKNVHGKEDTLITIQVDRYLAERLDMSYIDADGEKKRPYIIHRTSVGCYERTLAILIEKYAGAMPLWLAPEQIRILPISEKHHDACKALRDKIAAAGIRVTMDDRSEKVGYKIREAQLSKLPYMLVVGDKEVEENSVSVRKRGQGDLGVMPAEDFLALAQKEIAERVIF
ncbi:MAG: threonine--tRNA ligase [Acutalibacteraceae bacterium]|jgi:threonyl-tRNA synthetase